MGEKPLERAPSLVQQVIIDLEERIFCGSLPPGSKIRESKLAAELGVSRGPVREACHNLVGDRLMVTLPNKGSHVRWVTPRAAHQLFEIREELSGLIARAITNGDPQALAKRLDRHVERIDACTNAHDLKGFFPANLTFHEALLAGTRNERLSEIFLGIFKELRIFRLQSFLAEQDQTDRVLDHNRASNKGHRAIVAAIRTGDTDQIDAILRHQVRASRDRSAAAFARSHLDVPQDFRQEAVSL